jgi:hypothetical protein
MNVMTQPKLPRSFAEIEGDIIAADHALVSGPKGSDEHAAWRQKRRALRTEAKSAIRAYAANLTLDDLLEVAIEKADGGAVWGLLSNLNTLLKRQYDEETAYTADRMLGFAREIAADPETLNDY